MSKKDDIRADFTCDKECDYGWFCTVVPNESDPEGYYEPCTCNPDEECQDELRKVRQPIQTLLRLLDEVEAERDALRTELSWTKAELSDCEESEVKLRARVDELTELHRRVLHTIPWRAFGRSNPDMVELRGALTHREKVDEPHETDE